MIVNVHKLGHFFSTHVSIVHTVLDWNPLFGLGAPVLGINFDQQEFDAVNLYRYSRSLGCHIVQLQQESFFFTT